MFSQSERKRKSYENLDDDKSCHSLPRYFSAAEMTGEDAFSSLRASSSGESTEVEAGLTQSSLSCDAKTIANKKETQPVLPASTRDTSPYSTSSAVIPFHIPFGDGSAATLRRVQASINNSHGDKSASKTLYETVLSNNESQSEEKGSEDAAAETPVVDPKGNRVLFAKSTQKRSNVQKCYQLGIKKEIPSVVEECNDGANVSAISWTEDSFKVGKFNLAKHTDPNNVILYQVISMEEAGALMEGKGTFETESPLLSHSLSELLEVDSKASERQSYSDSRISWKVKAALCVAGVMILATGLFVGIVIALLNVDELKADEGLGNLTAQNGTISTSAPPPPTSPPTMRKTLTPTQLPLGTTTTKHPSTKVPTVVPVTTESDAPIEAPTSRPSTAPSISLYDLLDLPSHTWQAMANSTSHHSRAFKFLQQDPSLASYSKQRILQRFVLSVLFHSTGGDSWLRYDSWFSNDVHECDWWSVVCGQREEVLNITLRSNSLVGHLPPELSLLTTLKHLDLSDNSLSEDIPSYLGDLVNLQTLQLGFNQLSSTVPGELGNLTSLTDLNLTANFLIGTLPLSWMSLSKLVRLVLADNRFTGSLPAELGLWKGLKELQLQKNRFRGSIPVQVGKLEHMKKLSLFDNEFSGTLPTEIALVGPLKHLELDANSFTGSLPSELGLLTNLKRLWLSSNSFVGSIPSTLGRISNLEGLYMQVNQFSGLLPSELGNLRHLQEMRIFENKLRAKVR